MPLKLEKNKNLRIGHKVLLDVKNKQAKNSIWRFGVLSLDEICERKREQIFEMIRDLTVDEPSGTPKGKALRKESVLSPSKSTTSEG